MARTTLFLALANATLILHASLVMFVVLGLLLIVAGGCLKWGWTGKRWFPFFGLAFNEIEGTFYPLSDIELTQPQVEEINETARDFKQGARVIAANFTGK